MENKHFKTICHNFIDDQDDRKIKLYIYNQSPYKKIIPKHTTLAKIASCEVLTSIRDTNDLVNYLKEDLQLECVCSTNEAAIDTSQWKPSSQVKIKNKTISKDQIKKLKDLIDRYHMVFSRNDEDIGTILDRYGQHDIILSNNKPIKQRPYKIPFAKEQVVDECVKKMLKMGIIEPSNSQWSSPIVLVKKPDGSERFCVDYRKVNEATIKDCFPMPNVEDKLNKLHGCQFFTKLDCTSGYWQIKMSEKAKKITAFICHKGLYQFNVMPFGLCNAGATFQRIMESVLSDLHNSTAYIDDIFTFSKTFDEHLIHLEKLFERLKDANIKIKTRKCEFACEETMFLGYNVTNRGIKIDEERIKAIKDYPRPKTPKQVKRFIGLASYYRQFIDKFADIVQPLNKLTRKNCRFDWTDDCEKSFNKLINQLINAPILAFPDFNRSFYLSTDASNIGLGAVLYQLDDQKREKVIFYASRSLKDCERNYSAIEKELLAIVFAVEKFKYYLYGREFTINTDHNPLTYLNNVTLASSRLTRWRLKLSEYNFKIIYKRGVTNSNADALSRIEPDNKQLNKEDIIEGILAVTRSKKEVMKDEIIYHQDNILESKEKYIAICSPRDMRSTCGILNKIRQRHGETQLIKQNIRVGDCIVQVDTSGRTIIYLITKNSSSDKPSQESFKQCISKLAKMCKERKIETIAVPKMENGLDRLPWSQVTLILNKFLIQKGIQCHVYTGHKAKDQEEASSSCSINDMIRRQQIKDIIMVIVISNVNVYIIKFIRKTIY